MSGYGAAGGFDFQAEAVAYVGTYILTEQPLGWFADLHDVPVAVSGETRHVGDDLAVTFADGTTYGVQAKKGLSGDEKFRAAVIALLRGLDGDPSARAMLLVDATSSDPVKVRFRKDVERLASGRNDDLADITEALLTAAKDAGVVVAADVWSRLRVHVLRDSFEKTAILLREVVAETAAIETAWRLLNEDGLEVIVQRQARNAGSLLKFLRRHVRLRGSAATAVATLERHREWATKTYAEFFSVGIGKHLPAAQAWQEVRPVRGDDAPRSEPTTAARLVEEEKRIVIVGPSGAGKSTLSVALASAAAARGDLPLRVRLRALVPALRDGTAFDDALAAAVLSVDDLAHRRTVIHSLDLLIADGLDECGANAASVAEKLREWANGRPDLRVVLTTRTGTLDAAAVPNFLRADVLPLDEPRELARQLLQALSTDEQAVAAASARLEPVLALEESAASRGGLASNPLLLSFLVRLAVEGVQLDGNRADLYRRLIERIHTSTRPDRSYTVELSPSAAERVLQHIGWFVIFEPTATLARLRAELPRALAGKTTSKSLADAEQLLDDGIVFWEERGLFERDADLQLLFAHESLAEFAAAWHLTKLSDAELHGALDGGVDEPIIRFAAELGDGNRIAETLLALKTARDGDAELAAIALAETEQPDQSLCRSAAERLARQMTSDVPFTSVEAAIALVQLAPIAPADVSRAVQPLLEDERLWVRHGAVAVALRVAADEVPLPIAKRWIDEYEAVSPFSTAAVWAREQTMPHRMQKVQQVALPAALDRILSSASDESAAYAKRALAKCGTFNMLAALEPVLRKQGFGEVYESFGQRVSRSSNEILEWFERESPFEGRLIEELENAAGVTTAIDDAAPVAEYPRLAKVMTALEVDSLASMFHDDDDPVRLEVLRGVVRACTDELPTLIREARSFRANLLSEKSIFVLRRDGDTRDVDYRRGVSSLDLDLVARGLHHRSEAIIGAAAQLIRSADLKEETLVAYLGAAMPHRASRSLEVVTELAEELLPPDGAAQLLIEGLGETSVRGHGFVYYALARLFAPCNVETRTRIRSTLIAALTAANGYAAADAARVINAVGDATDQEVTDAIRAAFQHWRDVQPDGETPLSILLNLLETRAPLSDDELLAFITETDARIRHVAEVILTKRLRASTSLHAAVIDRLHAQPPLHPAVSLHILQTLLRLPPDQMKESRVSLESLFKATLPHIRRAMLKALPAEWLDHAAAMAQVSKALGDSSPDVRSAAAAALRRLEKKNAGNAARL